MPRTGAAARAAIAIAVVVAGALIGIVTAGAKKAPEPARAPGLRADVLPRDLAGSPAPRIRLADAAGGTVDTAALRGRPYLLSFVYTRCRDVCPVIGQEIGDGLRRLGPQAKDVDALLVSVDPRHDTPAAAERWLRIHGVGPRAHYLLGSSRQLLPVWRDWYVVPRTGGAGFDPTNHDTGIWLVDARGRLRGRWSGGGPVPPADLAHDLRALLAEAHR